MARTTEERNALYAEIKAIPNWYHIVDLGDDIMTPGEFCLSDDLEHYPFPEEMQGMRVLDVGASNGFYSYEFERRGAAEVVALDLGSWLDHDWSPRFRRDLEQYSKEDLASFDQKMMRAGFELIGRELGSTRVRKEEMSIYDISPERLGMFDLVFSGALLMHVRDPILGIQRMRSVCKDDGAIVISTSASMEEIDAPVARFAGMWNECNFWQMNPACVKQVLVACDFELTGEETIYDQFNQARTFKERLFVCRARPRRGD